MKKRNLLILLALVMAMAMLCAACGKKSDDTTDAGEEAVETEPEITGTAAHDSSRSYLTGLPLDESLVETRPVAVMIENTSDNMPQYGIADAGVVLEAPVEGGLTRLMALFDDYSNLDKIGNVRSARPYFIYFASEFDALFVHYGQSIHGEVLLGTGIVDDLNGMNGESSRVFYRTTEHAAPHNAYTSYEGIQAGISYKGVDMSYPSDFEDKFTFASDDDPITLDDGEDVEVIDLYFGHTNPYFIYNEEDGLYYRYQFGSAQKDANTGNQVAVTNIIFQYINNTMYEETQYLNINLTGSGKGKYFTNGKMIDITWEREGDTTIYWTDQNKNKTHYYDADGNELVINQGKTWVSLIQEPYADDNKYYATEEEFKKAN